MRPVPAGVAPVADDVLSRLRQELDAAAARLPGALTSDVPELMIDYLATVFTEQDVQPVAREPVGDNAGTWNLLEGCLSDDPDSAAVTNDLMGMAKAAEMTRSAIAGIESLEIASTQNLGYLDPDRDRSQNGAQTGPGLVTCTVCKRIMLAASFSTHGRRCRGPPKEPQPPPPKAAAKRAGTGLGPPPPKRPRGRGRPPPGKSKLSISGKPAQPPLPPPSVSAAAQSFAAAHGLPMQNGQYSAQPLGAELQWGAALPSANASVLPLPQQLSPVEVPVELVASVQQVVEAGAAPSRRRRSALPRKPRNVGDIKFQSPSPPPAGAVQPTTQARPKPQPKRKGRPPKQEQQPASVSQSGWQAQQPQQFQQHAAAAAAAAVTPAPAQQQRQQQQQRVAQGLPMPMAYGNPGMPMVAMPMQWAGQQPAASASVATLQYQQQMVAQQQQTPPRGGGWVRQVPTSAPSVALSSAAARGTVNGQQQQQAQQARPFVQGQGGNSAPQQVPLSPQQRAELQRHQANLLQQERQRRWAQLSPQQRQQLLMQHQAKKQALAAARAAAQSGAHGQQQPQAQRQVPVNSVYSGVTAQSSAVPQLQRSHQSQPMLTQQQMQQQQQQLLAQRQQVQQRQQQQQQQQHHHQQHQQQQQHHHHQHQQQGAANANGALHQAAMRQYPAAGAQQQQPQQQQVQAQRPQQQGSVAGGSPPAHSLPTAASAAQFQYPNYPTMPLVAPAHLVNLSPGTGMAPVRSPTFGGPAPGRTLAEQHFMSSNPNALQAVAAQGMPPARAYSSLKTLSAQLPELATPAATTLPYAE